MQCKKYTECGRDVFYEPSGLCLTHEKARRKAEQKAAGKTTHKRPTKPRTGRTEPRTQTTQAVTQTTEAPTETRTENP